MFKALPEGDHIGWAIAVVAFVLGGLISWGLAYWAIVDVRKARDARDLALDILKRCTAESWTFLGGVKAHVSDDLRRQIDDHRSLIKKREDEAAAELSRRQAKN
jgi:hypothetical protein